MITIEEEYAEAEVYSHYLTKDMKTVFLIKVSFPDAGLYINSITAQASDKFPGKELWVQLPRYNSRGKWYRPFETSNDSPFWMLVEKLATSATKRYSEEQEVPTEVVDDVAEVDVDEPINLDDIPF